MQLDVVPDELALLSPPFSILGRIGGDATSFPPKRGKEGRNFQYPRSDRRRCNGATAGGSRGYLPLSVSSVGSEAMQHRPQRRREYGDKRLSVSSVGSEAMQRPSGTHAIQWNSRAFSILGRIGGDATIDDVPASIRRLYTFSILGRIGGDATHGLHRRLAG